MTRTIRNPPARERAVTRKKRREERAVQRIARRVPKIIATLYDGRLRVHDDNELIYALQLGGVRGREKCGDKEILKAVDQSVAQRLVDRRPNRKRKITYDWTFLVTPEPQRQPAL